MASIDWNDETIVIKDNKGQKIHLFNDDQYHSAMLENLNMLRKNRQFCDVILQIGTNHQDIHEIYAHKVVLSSSSTYLFEMFMNHEYQPNITNNGNMNGSLQSINTLNVPQQFRLVSATNFESDPEAFGLIIDYAYTATLKIPESKVREIYSIASRLKMTNVANKCGQIILSMLSAKNCLEIRNMKAVLNDASLLQSIDVFIRQHFEQIVESSSFIDSQLTQIKIEFLLNSEQEEHSINDRHMLNEVLEWIRSSLEHDVFDLDRFKDGNTMLMLHYDKTRNEIQDCCQIESNSPEESEMIEDYKKLNKRIALIRKSLSQDNIPNGLVKSSVPSSKPRQFLFTRSDSESSLCSSATDGIGGTGDDDVQDHQHDWKVLANCRLGSGNHTLVGLVSITAGQLCLLSITLRIKESTSKQNSLSESGQCDQDDITQQYCLIPPMSSARCAVGTANFKGKLFVCGGYDRGECLKTVELYDTVENRWQLLQPMQVPRGRFSVAVVDNCVYAIGGCDGHDELNSAEVYDKSQGEWKSIQSAPVARSNAGVCSMNGKIYVIGGWNGNRGMTRCDKYDPRNNQWTDMAPLNIGRYQTGCCSLDSSTIYSVGGCDSWSCLNTVEQYSSYTGQWRLVAPLQTARRGCGVASIGGKIFAVGGHDGIHALCSVEIYDPEEDQWTYGKSMTMARANVGVAVIDNRLYAVGGFNGKAFINTIEYFDMENDQWTTSVTILDSICSVNYLLKNGCDNDKQEEKVKKIDTNDGDSMKDTNNNNNNNNNQINSKNKFEKKMSGNTSFNQSLGSVMEVEETLKQA